jgi:putative transposase
MQQFFGPNGITQNMSRRGNCLDNAVIENFFSNFKSEMLYTHKITTLEQLNQEVDKYIYFYNHERYQRKLRDMAPAEYRNHITKSA